MKKIFNWTFGSVFRTFGRIIAYIIIGFIVSVILSNSDFRITDLFLDRVKADTLTTNKWTTFYNDANKTSALSSKGNLHQYFQLASNGNGITSKTLYFNENIEKNSTYDYIKIPFMLTGADMATTDETQYFCSYKLVNNEYIPYTCSYQGSDTVSIPISLNYRFSATLITNGGGLTTCSFETDNIKCYLNPGYTYVGLNFTYNVWQDSLPYLQALFGHTVGYYKDSQNTIIENQQTIIQQQENQTQQQENQTQQIIESQNQTQQTIIESTNQTISTITDSTSPDLNGTLDNNTVAGWLPAGPIDSIVTLPLTMLNSLFNAMGGTCADLTVPLPFIDSELSIPCMSRVYNSMSFGSFFNWIGIVASAFILYKYLLRLYKWIDATLTLRENTQVDWGGD